MNSPGPNQLRQPGGNVEVSDQAVIAVIHDAVLSCYGIVDMAPRSIRSAIGKRLGIGSTELGISIARESGRLTIDLSVVVEYGTPIFTVATNVMQTVRFRVEEVLGMEVDRVNIHVDGLHVTIETGGTA